MKHIHSDYQWSLVSDEQIQKLHDHLIPEIERLRAAQQAGYETDYASINVPFDKQMIRAVQETVAFKKKLNPRMLIVIGVGGSHLGAYALHRVLNGSLYNQLHSDMQIHFVDSIDVDYINHLLILAEQKLKNNESVLINVITKSGSTTETIVNFTVFVDLLKHYYPADYHTYVVATTDEGSPLYRYAQEQHMTTLTVPARVGGRYSVFTPVGLFPLAMVGVDVEQLCAGAVSMVEQCARTGLDNDAARNAASIYYHYQDGKKLFDTFVFGNDREILGKWYRQLMAESIGKENDRQGNQVRIGLMPTVSVGSADLHSVVQLYLGGAYDRFTGFVVITKNKTDCTVPELAGGATWLKGVTGQSLGHVSHAVDAGVQVAYQKDKRPFYITTLPEANEYYIGQWMQCKMIEIMYLSFLLNVNPFNQPHVELYKRETRKILANE